MSKHSTPIQITIYGPDDEILGEYQRLIVPWGMLKRAIRLSKGLDENNIGEEDIDAISDLLVEVFGNRFSREDLEQGCDIGDIFAAFMAIVNKASGIVPNPPPPA